MGKSGLSEIVDSSSDGFCSKADVKPKSVCDVDEYGNRVNFSRRDRHRVGNTDCVAYSDCIK